MDLALIRTFLEVAATGSFGAAAERLFVTQSAVSLRVQRLEDQLGLPLFTRSKAGAELTPAGREFEPFALSLIQTWQKARQQVAIPEGFNRSLTVGAQYSIWPRLGFAWVDALRAEIPDLSLRVEVGMPDRLTRMLVEGYVQTALMYSPTLRPGLRIARVMDDELILCASWPGATLADLPGRYAFVDWGPEFVSQHALDFPGLTNPGLTLALGSLTADFLIGHKMAAYLPGAAALRAIEAGQLHPVDSAPVYPYPVWSVWREDVDPALMDQAAGLLASVAVTIDRATQGVMESFHLHLRQFSAHKHE